MTSALTVGSLWIYPLKSAAGLRVSSAQMQREGLEHDRRWMLIDPDGHMLTQRTCPQMAHLSAQITASGALHLTTPNRWAGEAFIDPPPPSAPSATAYIWGDAVLTHQAPETASAWLAALLSRPCRLVYLQPTTQRPLGPDYAHDHLSLADGFPLLLMTQPTLQDLHARAPRAADLRRFRPNLIIDGPFAPFAEDAWRRLRIGSVYIELVKPCARCGLVNVDPDTATSSPDTLSALRAYRKTPSGDVLFGQNAIPRILGTICAGDSVEVLE